MQYRTSLALSDNGRVRVKLASFDKETSFDPTPDNYLTSESPATSDSSAALSSSANPAPDHSRDPKDPKDPGGPIPTASTSLTNTIHLLTDSYTAPPHHTGPSNPMPSMSMISSSAWSPSSAPTTTPSSYPSHSSLTSRASHLNNGAKTNIILGSILGGVFGVVAILLALFCGMNIARRRRAKAVYKEHSVGAPSADDNFEPKNSWGRSQAIDLDESVPYVAAPAPFDRSPFDSNDLLQINHLAAPQVPEMSTRRVPLSHTHKLSQFSGATAPTVGSEFYQFRPRPEIRSARRAPPPPIPGIAAVPNAASLASVGPNANRPNAAQKHISQQGGLEATQNLAAYKAVTLQRMSNSSSIYSVLEDHSAGLHQVPSHHTAIDQRAPSITSLLKTSTELSTELNTDTNVEPPSTELPSTEPPKMEPPSAAPYSIEPLSIDSRHSAAMAKQRSSLHRNMRTSYTRVPESRSNRASKDQIRVSNDHSIQNSARNSIETTGTPKVYDDGRGAYPDFRISLNDLVSPAASEHSSSSSRVSDGVKNIEEEPPKNGSNREPSIEIDSTEPEDPLDSYLSFAEAYTPTNSEVGDHQ